MRREGLQQFERAIAEPAAGWSGVERRSDALAAAIAVDGPTPELLDFARGLIEDASRTGETENVQEWREVLSDIISYWTSVLRRNSDEFVPAPPLAEHRKFALSSGTEAASKRSSISGVKSPSAQFDQIEQALQDVKSTRTADLEFDLDRPLVGETVGPRTLKRAMVLGGVTVFSSHFTDLDVHELKANDTIVWGSLLSTLRVRGSADFSGAVLRSTQFDHCFFEQETKFVNSDLADWSREDKLGTEISRLQPIPKIGEGVVFSECDFFEATFRQADLRGTKFERCRFHDGANFSGALLARAAFIDCEFQRSELRAAADFSTAEDVSLVSFAGTDTEGFRFPAGLVLTNPQRLKD